jgi:hypothetical protein
MGRLSAKGGHAHIQVVPVPRDLANDVESAFREAGEIGGITFEAEDPEKSLTGSDSASYFRVELPDKRKLVSWLQDRTPFSVQFGRYETQTHLPFFWKYSQRVLDRCWHHYSK